MEPEMPININSEEINRMSLEDQKAMAEFANMEQQKMRLQSSKRQPQHCSGPSSSTTVLQKPPANFHL